MLRQAEADLGRDTYSPSGKTVYLREGSGGLHSRVGRDTFPWRESMSNILPILLAQAGPDGSACGEWCIPPTGPDRAGTPRENAAGTWTPDADKVPGYADAMCVCEGAAPEYGAGETSDLARKGGEGV